MRRTVTGSISKFEIFDQVVYQMVEPLFQESDSHLL